MSPDGQEGILGGSCEFVVHSQLIFAISGVLSGRTAGSLPSATSGARSMPLASTASGAMIRIAEGLTPFPTRCRHRWLDGHRRPFAVSATTRSGLLSMVGTGCQAQRPKGGRSSSGGLIRRNFSPALCVAQWRPLLFPFQFELQVFPPSASSSQVFNSKANSKLQLQVQLHFHRVTPTPGPSAPPTSK